MGEEKNKPKEEEKDIGPALKFFSVLIILRGLVNLVFPVLFNAPFDEFFLGSNAVIVLNSLFIVSGVGVLLRRDWGYFIALPVCLVALLMQSDSDALERVGGEVLSLFMLTVFWSGWRRGYAAKTPKGKRIAFAAIVIFLLIEAYDYNQPSESELREYYAKLAREKTDYTICDNIESGFYRGHCYKGVSLELKDPHICELIENENARESCYSDNKRFFGKNEEYCNNITDENIRKKVCVNLGGAT